MRYVIELNERQAGVVHRALDLYSRVLSGQLDAVPYELRYEGLLPHDKGSLLEEALKKVPIEERGISNTQFNAKIAYDILQVVRHRLAWDKSPTGGIHVDFDPPLFYSGIEPPKMTAIESSKEL